MSLIWRTANSRENLFATLSQWGGIIGIQYTVSFNKTIFFTALLTKVYTINTIIWPQLKIKDQWLRIFGHRSVIILFIFCCHPYNHPEYSSADINYFHQPVFTFSGLKMYKEKIKYKFIVSSVLNLSHQKACCSVGSKVPAIYLFAW